MCEDSLLFFTRLNFKVRQGNSFRLNWHHHYLADELEKVWSGETKNLIVNVAPGGTKTELVVINFMAWALAKNHWCRFLHLSYSDDLALLNSQVTRDIVCLEEFQALWPLAIAEDSKAKKRWNVQVFGKKTGGVYATSLGGQITGFRAGHMREGFQGAIIIDDPLKPKDAFSKPKITAANRDLVSTVKSRRANPDTPIIVIMQRIAEEDPTGFIVGKPEKVTPERVVRSPTLGGEWKHITIPAVLDSEYVSQLPEKYRQMIERDSPDRFSYWPYKEPIQDLLAMEDGIMASADGSRISRHVFSSQYQQQPRAIGGNLLRGDWFKRYRHLPKLKYRVIIGDTAQKTKERNDYSVFACFGLGAEGGLYLLDLIRGKWEAPELERRVLAFWAKHSSDAWLPAYLIPPPGVDVWAGQLRKLFIEDKASGTGLIQKIKTLGGFIPVHPVERNKDKLTRVMDVQGYIEQGMVHVPEEAPFTSDFIEECEAFTADDTHPFDDQVDVLVDAVDEMLSSKNKLEVWSSLGKQK